MPGSRYVPVEGLNQGAEGRPASWREMPDPAPLFEFHIRKEARKRYACEEALFGAAGNVVFMGLGPARKLAETMNDVRGSRRNPALAVSVADLYAMGLIDEMMHLVTDAYRKQAGDVFDGALAHLAGGLGGEETRQVLLAFTEQFPPLAVHRGTVSGAGYLEGETAGLPHRSVAAEELLHLSIANANPAFAPFGELFDDGDLQRSTRYPDALAGLQTFLAQCPPFGNTGLNLYDFLMAPVRAFPHSLSDQLRYIRENWRAWIPVDLLDSLLARLLRAADYLHEEHRPRGFGKGLEPVHDSGLFLASLRGADGQEPEPERYSPDLDWMPNVVMIAKNIHVWLWQLSQRFGRSIARLDQVPDEVLAELARQGFTALWLIGVWERSAASLEIKRRMGNSEAMASAYSLHDYTVAGDLGGDDAYWNLKERAWRKGVRVAVDMVPNHTGIYSRWVVEHPDWFIQLEHPPYPCYTFDGPDLSRDPGVGLFLEDGYWNRSDAAVVFKRLDRRTGEVRYLYHGNDGTHMPWNDTAQLNYLLPEVREAVIGQILRVSRYSSVIRFDAAMTLAKRHYQRLWYPEPGSGGDIPSRAERGLTKDDFNAAFPEEFWREVVDRCAAESPDTLLLAEAFWLMEGYFVRTLGMHRVYNSAFMNMLKREDNANYRAVFRNILEFDPEILKRFVNFMNNPDEDPAVAQFGKDDKYFGVCVMMSTLPGLPMFGHGQVQGFGEKYGMEYARPYWDETADPWLEERHAREVFPLLRLRWMFSGVENFLLYDVVDDAGHVREDVFAYSNGRDGARALVAYNNRFAHNEGWVRLSVSFRDKGSGELVRRTLGEGLALADSSWTIFRDRVSGLEYLRPTAELRQHGFRVSLDAFKYQVFMDFQEARGASEAEWGRLYAELGGRGVPNLWEALQETRLRPVFASFDTLVDPDGVVGLFDRAARSGSPADLSALDESFVAAGTGFLARCREMGVGGALCDQILAGAQARVQTAARLDAGLKRMADRRSPRWRKFARLLEQEEAADVMEAGLQRKLFYVFVLVDAARRLAGGATERRLFLRHIRARLPRIGLDPHFADELVSLWDALLEGRGAEGVSIGADGAFRGLDALLLHPETQSCLGCNWHNGIYWFNREKFLLFLHWLFFSSVLEAAPKLGRTRSAARLLLRARESFLTLLTDADGAQYNFHRFLAAVSVPASDSRTPRPR